MVLYIYKCYDHSGISGAPKVAFKLSVPCHKLVLASVACSMNSTSLRFLNCLNFSRLHRLQNIPVVNFKRIFETPLRFLC